MTRIRAASRASKWASWRLVFFLGFVLRTVFCFPPQPLLPFTTVLLHRRSDCCKRNCCTPGVYLVVLCGFVLCQTAIVTGLFSSSISSIEKRYNFTSADTGLLSSYFDIVVMAMVPVVTFFAGRPAANKPRFMGVFAIVLAIGALLFALPQLIR